MLQHALQNLNQFISDTSNPLPLLNDPTTVVDSLKSYFSDPHIFISYPTEEETTCSLFHYPTFISKVQAIHREWIQAKPNLFNEKESLVSFFTYLCQKMPDIIVSYSSVSEEKNESQNSSKQTRKKVTKNSILSKRLRYIFDCFSKHKIMRPQQNTFEELNEIYSNLDLSQWLQVVKSFQLYGKKQLMPKQLRRVKLIFEQFSNKQKRLNFQDFSEALKAVFYDTSEKQKEKALEEGYDRMGIWKKEEYEQKLRSAGIHIPKQKFTLKISEIKNIKKPQNLKQSRKNHSLNNLVLKPLSQKNVAYRYPSDKAIRKNKIDLQKIVKEEKDEFLEQYQKKQFSSGVLRRIDERITRVIGKK